MRPFEYSEGEEEVEQDSMYIENNEEFEIEMLSLISDEIEYQMGDDPELISIKNSCRNFLSHKSLGLIYIILAVYKENFKKIGSSERKAIAREIVESSRVVFYNENPFNKNSDYEVESYKERLIKLLQVSIIIS